MPEKLSAFIITKNEEDKIARCLAHLTWVDELIILDSDSTDKTVDIAKKYSKKIFKKKFEGYGPQKQAAIEKCSNEWILEIDADEIVPEELKKEIQTLMQEKEKLNKYVAYTIKRQEFFMGKALMTSTIPRFYRKDKVKYQGMIHEKLEIQGPVGKLKNEIIHEADKYDTIAKRIEKINEYTKKEAEIMYKEKQWSIAKVLSSMITIPPCYFLWMMIRKGLIWKGYRGLIWSLLTAYYHFLIYAKVYEYIYKEKQKPINPIYSLRS